MSLSPHPRTGISREQWKAIADAWLKPMSGKAITGSRIALGLFFAASVIGSLMLANWVTTDYGFIPVGFGLEATAGTFFAGIMLVSRDVVQDTIGRWAVLVIIVVGTGVSFTISAPAIAFASAIAFSIAELLDFAVYTPIRMRAKFGDRTWGLAVVASSIVGALADSVLFLSIAFGWEAVAPALAGQMVGKLWATLSYLVLGWLVARLILSWALPERRAEALAPAAAS